MRILLALFLLLSLAYIWVDRQLYFYGRSDLEFYNPLPVRVKPNYWGYDLGNSGFVLVDDFEFVVAGKGTKYRNSEVIVADIVKYGFDKQKIVVVVLDSLGNEHLIRLSNLDHSRIEGLIVDKVDQSRLTWVEIYGNDHKVRMMGRIHSTIRVGLVVLIVIISIRAVRRLKRSV